MNEDYRERVERIRERVAERAPKGKRRQVAAAIGVSSPQLGDFVDGKVANPTEETLAKYEAFLAGADSRDDCANGPPSGELEFWVRYDAIANAEMPETLKLWRIDAMAAALRQFTQAKDAAATEARTRLMEMELELARTRAAAYAGESPPFMPVTPADDDIKDDRKAS